MKNIFSAFARIGDIFKGTAVSSKVFMPLPKMFNVLKEYSIFSAIDIFPAVYALLPDEDPNAAPSRNFKSLKFVIAGNQVMVSKNPKEGKSLIFLKETTTPDVLDEAAEHYYRIPRLLELYKDLFEYDGDTEKKVTMIP